MIKKILMMLVIAVGFTAAAYAGPRENVEAKVKEMSAELPVDLGEGVSIQALLMEGDNVIMVMSMPIPAEYMPMLKEQAPMMKSQMLQEFKADPEMKGFLNNLKKINGNFIISLTTSEGEADPIVLLVTAAEL